MTSNDMLVRTIRVRNRHEPGVFGQLATAIGDQQATLGTISTVALTSQYTVRDLDVLVDDEAHLQRVLDAIAALPDSQVLEVRDEVLEAHHGGKIRTVSRRPIGSLAELRKVYTPGVAEVCLLLRHEPALAYRYTGIGQLVAIVTDGTAILGLGNIGPLAGLPVMEGKAALFAELAGLNGVPVLLTETEPNRVADIVSGIASSFGAIQLEDFAAPECFEIEQLLRERLAVPVLHDDQHGTAVVTLAALINAARRTGLDLQASCVGQIGLGAAGAGIVRLLRAYGVERILGTDLNAAAVARLVAAGGEGVTLEALMQRADIVIATTGVRGLIKPQWVRKGQE